MYRLVILIGLAVAAVIAALLAPRVPQDPAYHNFIDQRLLLGVPNFWNVVSNVPFFFVGVYGLWAWPRAKWEQVDDRRAWAVVVAAAFLIGAGSGYYHWSPDNLTLFWDRLPMTIGFMGVFSAVIAERVHQRVGYFLLGPFLVLGILSVEVWRQGELAGVGDLRFYALVQFYPMLAIPLMLWLYRSRYTHSAEIWRMVIWYVAAKLLEMFDREIWAITGSQMSGHALKHVAAAIALWMPLRMIAHRDVERKNA